MFQPTPFQIAGRYESSLVNAYFDILIRYGDQSQVINFRDLIEVESFRDGQVDVRLRNLEYDLTRAINKAVYGFQDLDSIVAALPSPATMSFVVTPNTLPSDLLDGADTVRKVGADLAAAAGDKFQFEEIDPDAPDARLNRDALLDGYGLQPFAASLFDPTTYYMAILLKVGDQTQVIYPSGDMTEATIRQSLESGLKRFSSGFLEVVGLWRPVIGPDPTLAQMGQTQQPPFSTWDTLYQRLSQDYEVRLLDLADGQVAPDVDVLLVVAPQNMTDIQRYAVDQFLMRGGSVIVAGSSFRVTTDPMTGMLTLAPIEGGLGDLLDHYGVTVENTMVMDPQNEPFPIAVNRNVQGFTVQEIQSLPYPYFVDVRADGMASGNPMLANLSAVTLNWVSPVRIDETKNATRTVTTLTWTSSPTRTSTRTPASRSVTNSANSRWQRRSSAASTATLPTSRSRRRKPPTHSLPRPRRWAARSPSRRIRPASP